MDILRIITAGNVDDGKSTLIGRLLYDTGNIKLDVVQSLSEGDNQEINLAQVTDGLRSERAQGITIDVAYKYFTTAHRKFILTDAPGHFHYTKNLVTGASNVDAIIILIDACNGITEQTKRHSLVASFLKIPSIFVVINKMDAVHYSQEIFEDIRSAYEIIAQKLELPSVQYIPVSALLGDNVIAASDVMAWYDGPTLLSSLEECRPSSHKDKPFRLPIQLVYSDGTRDILMGKVSAGTIHVGDKVTLSGNNQPTAIEQISVAGRPSNCAKQGQSVALYITAKVNVQRGQIVHSDHSPVSVTQELRATLCWLEEQPLLKERAYYFQINGTRGLCTVKPQKKFALDTFELVPCSTLGMNEIATADILLEIPAAFDTFADNRETGRGILINPITYNTCAAFVID